MLRQRRIYLAYGEPGDPDPPQPGAFGGARWYWRRHLVAREGRAQLPVAAAASAREVAATLEVVLQAVRTARADPGWAIGHQPTETAGGSAARAR
ncbi:MAG: hypothetical protein M3P18_20380 [Actinomycetota bacterium]|nr:hypothetical protein [Actinomycetota bacterium]